MLGYLFLFYGRMGRLQYALWAWIFVPLIFFLAIVVGIFVIAFGLHAGGSKTVIFAFTGLVFALFTWVELSLSAVRIRDIGWKPGIVIPVVIAINFIDLGVAYVVPAWADATGLHTIVPSVFGFLYSAVLLFTPTDGQEMVPFIIPGLSLPRVNLGFFARRRPEPRLERKPRQPPFEARHPTYPRERVPFGRRGLT